MRRWRREFRVGDRRVLGVRRRRLHDDRGLHECPRLPGGLRDERGNAEFPVGSFLVPGEQTLLIDAGIGPFSTAGLSGGALLDELAALGVQPADIDVIAVSHLHLDHDGWLATRDGGVTFPNAVVHIGRRDYEYFVAGDPSNEFRMAAPQEGGARRAARRRPGRARRRRTRSFPESSPSPRRDTRRATSRFAVRDHDESLLILGDAMYCPAQSTDSDLTAMHDVDPRWRDQSRADPPRRRSARNARGRLPLSRAGIGTAWSSSTAVAYRR